MNPLIRGPVTIIDAGAAPGSLCDFCGLYLAKPYTTFCAQPFNRNYPHALLVIRDRWAACLECAALVRTHDWPAILDRLMNTYRAFSPDRSASGLAMVRSDLAGMFLELERKLTGEEVEVGDAA